MPTVLKINTRNLNQDVVQDLKEHYGNAELEIRVHNLPDSSEVMDEEEFWALIAMLDWSKTEDNSHIIEPAVAALSEMPVAKIYQFYDILSEKLWSLDTSAHADAMMRDDPDGYFSDDEFLYARCCVVANGKEAYLSVLADPSKFPSGLAFENLLYVAAKAYERKTEKRFLSTPAFNFETGSNKQGWQ
ncbi:MAG: DUF4240 domain-containing protein [Phaeodactylibacter sp.]|nr:DUF4240 domain-containing protein [Phaeodactylibacter sp.]